MERLCRGEAVARAGSDVVHPVGVRGRGGSPAGYRTDPEQADVEATATWAITAPPAGPEAIFDRVLSS